MNPSAAKSRPSARICAQAAPRVGSTNCGRNARKKSAVFGFDDPLPVEAPEVARRARPRLLLSLPAGEAADADDDQVRGAEVLDHVERDGGRGQERREPDRRGGDVDERPGRDPGYGCNPRAAAVRDALRDDIEHRRPGHHEQKQRGADEQRES
jgi:hypothetical protein